MIAGPPSVLSQIDPLRAASDRFQQGAGLAAVLLIVGMLVVVAAIWYVLVLVERRRDPSRVYHDPQRLLIELCRAHRLSRADRRLLKQIAEESALAQPAMLFVDRRLLEGAAARHPAARRLVGRLFCS